MSDYAGLLTPSERSGLESRLAQREQATGAQMVIAIFRSLEGESLEDYSIRLAERWRIGQKSLDNGVILLVFLSERKVRLEVGYGLEGAVPDAVAGAIVRDILAPRFREQRYAAGLQGAVDAVFARVAGEPAATPARPARRWPGLSSGLLMLLLFGVFGVAIWSAFRNAGRSYTVGGQGWRSHRSIRRSAGWGGPFVGGGWGGGGGAGGGGGFSGGGGGFGGGGASGDW